jgi:sugar phosphate isomerase/epimerase
MPLETSLRYLAVAGCEETEVAAMPGYLPRRSAIRRSLKKKGMQVTAVSLGVPFFFSDSRLNLHSPKKAVRDSTIEYVRKSIDFASHIESGLIYACSMERGTPGDRDKAIARLTETVVDCSDYAKANGVRFGLEPFPTGELPTVRETAVFVERAQSDNLGVLFDAGHAAISGEPLKKAAHISHKGIVHVHLNNNDGVGDLHWPPQTGKLSAADFEDLLLELNDQDYRGRISVELSKPRPVVETINRSREFVEGLLRRSH